MIRSDYMADRPPSRRFPARSGWRPRSRSSAARASSRRCARSCRGRRARAGGSRSSPARPARARAGSCASSPTRRPPAARSSSTGPATPSCATPYGPFAEALDQLARTVDPARLRADLGPGGGELQRLLPDLAARVGELPDAGHAPTRTRSATGCTRRVVELLIATGRHTPVAARPRGRALGRPPDAPAPAPPRRGPPPTPACSSSRRSATPRPTCRRSSATRWSTCAAGRAGRPAAAGGPLGRRRRGVRPPGRRARPRSLPALGRVDLPS